MLNANILTSSNCFFGDLKEFYERSSFSHGKVTNKQADPHIVVAVPKRRSLTPGVFGCFQDPSPGPNLHLVAFAHFQPAFLPHSRAFMLLLVPRTDPTLGSF